MCRSLICSTASIILFRSSRNIPGILLEETMMPLPPWIHATTGPTARMMTAFSNIHIQAYMYSILDLHSAHDIAYLHAQCIQIHRRYVMLCCAVVNTMMWVRKDDPMGANNLTSSVS